MIRRAIIAMLAVAALGTWTLWAVSWVAPQHVRQVSRASIHIYNLNEGGLWFVIIRNKTQLLSWENRYTRKVSIPRWFHITRYRGQTAYRRYDGRICLGTTTAVLAMYPTIALIRGPLRRWRRRRKGSCLKCGYDLTGNVSGLCPECGKPVRS